MNTATQPKQEVYLGNDFFIEDDDIEKLYWKMKDVSIILGWSISKLRLYSIEMGLLLKRSGGNNRRYQQKDIEQLRAFSKLRDAGFTIKGAVKNIDKADAILNIIS